VPRSDRPGAPITVVGVGVSPLPDLARTRIAEAALVVGGRRQLAAAAARPPDGATGGTGRRTFELTGDLGPAMTSIAACAGPVVVLASGDPGFFGIVRALAERFGRERLEVVPGVSSVAAAFARAALPWDDALVVSAHGRDPGPAINACLAHPKVAVLTGPGFGPAELAAVLARHGRRMLVAERLGEPDERVVEAAASEIAAGSWADPNVVVVFDEAAAVGAKGRAWPAWRAPGGWALPEAAFEHRPAAAASGEGARPWAGMVTKAEVRALALARLGPGPGDLVWDVGAGSGSVGVECARFGAAVLAVERDPAARALVAANAARHGVGVTVVAGSAPEVLEALPEPEAVFVGGTGGALEAVCKLVAVRARRAAVVALAGVERVVPAASLLAAGGLEVETVMLHSSRLRAVGGVHRLVPTNPVFLVSGVRP
jgi:precorrin-6Y C5,15-methyltransferase (decarboxylating)